MEQAAKEGMEEMLEDTADAVARVAKEGAEEVLEGTADAAARVVKEGTEGVLEDTTERAAKEAAKGSSNNISSVNDLTQEQLAALHRYTGPDYKNINDSLRGFGMATPENQEAINIIRETLENASLPDDMILYRGTSTKALGALEGLSPDELVGQTIYEDAFLSTSTSKGVATGTFSGNMQMTIEAPRGSNALDMASISQYHTESEILSNAGQSMLIISAEKNGVLYIYVRIQ